MLNEWERKLLDNIKKNELPLRTAVLNNQGIAAEKKGDIELAITYYEKNIQISKLRMLLIV